jgi:hypothetical protein
MAVIYKSLGNKKICGIKFYVASLIDIGWVNYLFLRTTVLKTSLISSIDKDDPRISLNKVSGIPPSITFCFPISDVYRTLSMKLYPVRVPPKILSPIFYVNKGMIDLAWFSSSSCK